MKKIFSIYILGVLGMIFLFTPTVFASSNVSAASSYGRVETIKNSIIMSLKDVGAMYSSLITHTFSVYKEGGATLIMSFKNNFKEPSPVLLPGDEITIITGPTVEK